MSLEGYEFQREMQKLPGEMWQEWVQDVHYVMNQGVRTDHDIFFPDQ
jgi:hypothetical protein